MAVATPMRHRWYKVEETPASTGTAPPEKPVEKPAEKPTENAPTPDKRQNPKFFADDLAKIDRRISSLEEVRAEVSGWTPQVIWALVLGGFAVLVIILSLFGIAFKRRDT